MDNIQSLYKVGATNLAATTSVKL